jgi:nitrile hydratase
MTTTHEDEHGDGAGGGHEHVGGHEHAPDDPRALRAEALEALLIERGLVEPESIDRILDRFEHDLGPMNGIKVVVKAWTDPAYKERLLADGLAALAELDLGGPQIDHLVVVENTPAVHNVVVCTLCSCYPWGLLGLPPAWYKSFAYRSRVVREPRAVLAEMGCELPDGVEIRVWDSSAEVRYAVLPERPAGTEGLSPDELAALITRDHLIGVAR